MPEFFGRSRFDVCSTGEMTVSQNGINFIKGFEGWMPTAYLDAVGVPTIGYGHTGSDVTRADVGKLTITESQGQDLLREDLTRFENAVNSSVTVPLNQNQFDALVSFTYNVGEGNLKQSTLLRLLNQGNYGAVSAQLMRWNKAGGKVLKGLTRRRQEEGFLFNS